MQAQIEKQPRHKKDTWRRQASRAKPELLLHNCRKIMLAAFSGAACACACSACSAYSLAPPAPALALLAKKKVTKMMCMLERLAPPS